MPFTAVVTERGYSDSKRKYSGTYVNTGGSVGGDIVTGLARVDSVKLQPTGATVKTDASVVNETFPVNNLTGAVTIVTTADESGVFEAEGV